MTGAKILVKCLLSMGVSKVFGYPGASILPLFDVLSSEKRIDVIVNTQEQFCAFAADGYARSTGKTGVCIATSGPGATNLVTGIANAYMDSIPLVAITGNVPVSLLGTDAFQETDIAGVTMPITKHNFIVKSVASLEETICKAFRIAESGRKGPVLVDITKNVFEEEIKYEKYSPPERIIPPVSGDINACAELINSSENPLICVGGGVIASGASPQVALFADKLGCPVASTAMGIGAFDGTNPAYVGLLGMNASDGTNKLLQKTDLFIAIGTRFSERMIGSLRESNCAIIQIDIDEAEIDKNLSPVGAISGDASEVLTHLLPLVRNKPRRLPGLSACKNTLYEIINDYFPDAIFSTEVGIHQVEACKRLKIKHPRSFLTSGGLGAMGYGLPAAIGAAVANPGRDIVNIAGDGSFNMNMQELATASRYSLNIVQIVINNHSLGMIEQWQKDKYSNRVFACDTPQIDYCALASSMGARAFRAETKAQLKNALESAIKAKGVCLIDCDISRSQEML